MVELHASNRFSAPTPAVPGGDLSYYIKACPDFFTSLDTPMGSALKPLDTDAGLFELTVPKIEVFDLWIQPRAKAVVRTEPCGTKEHRLVVGAQECELRGSSHVEKFKLNERFWLNVAITFTSAQPAVGAEGHIAIEGDISVQVDIPPPFSYMPRSVLQSTGNTALRTTLSVLLNTFSASMVKDYLKWSQQQHLEQQQATNILQEEQAGKQQQERKLVGAALNSDDD